MTIPFVVHEAKHGVLHLSFAATHRYFFGPDNADLANSVPGRAVQRKVSPLVDLLSLHLGLHRTKHRTVHTLASLGKSSGTVWTQMCQWAPQSESFYTLC
jgi:hypothetical protein